MQFRLGPAAIVFLGSYLPLSVILLAQNLDYAALDRRFCGKLWEPTCELPLRNPGFAIGIFLVCLACFLATLIVLGMVKPKHEITLVEVKYIPADLMNYTLPYVVSFMNIDYQDMSKFVGLLIFLGWMFWITYKSGQTLLNPLLIVFGWRLYELKYHFAGDRQERTSRALSKGPIDSGETHHHANITDILVIKPPPTET